MTRINRFDHLLEGSSLDAILHTWQTERINVTEPF